jgi:hypothetical protein
MEGSARFRQLLAAAQAAFTGSEAYERSSALLEAPKQRLQQLLADVDAAAAAVAGEGVVNGVQLGVPLQQQLRSPVAAVLDIDKLAEPVSEDGDTWMASEAEQLQQRLEQAELLAAVHTSKKQQRQPTTAAGGPAEDGDVTEVDAEQLVSGFRGFMHHLAGVEGAEVPATAPAAAGAGAAPASCSHSQGSKRHSRNAGSCGARQPEQTHAGKQQHSCGATAGRNAAAGLDFNPDAFLSELMGVLGAVGDPLQQQQQQQQQQQSPAHAQALLQQAQKLQQALEQKLAAFPGDQSAFDAAAAASWGDGDGGDSDDYGESGSSSSPEGSSFYGSDHESGDEGNDEPRVGVGEELDAGAAAAAAAELDPEFLEVPPPCSGRPSANGVTEQQRQRQQARRRQYRTRPDPQQQQWAKDGGCEVMTETDSDDDEDALSLGGSSDNSSGSNDGSSDGGTPGGAGSGGFYDSYSAALDAELSATTMAQTFEKVQVTPAAAADTAAASSSPAAADGVDAGLTPLDVDFNLIKSLVASYTAQGGLPGPASNLAGLLGVQLPTEVETQQQHQQQ